MKKFFKSLFKKKYVPKIKIDRLVDARFELNEMLVGVTCIHTRKSIMFWVEHISELRGVDFLDVALQLMDDELTRQKEAGYTQSKNITYPNRRQYKL